MQNKKLLFSIVTAVVIIIVGLSVLWSRNFNKEPEIVRYESRAAAIAAAEALSLSHEAGNASWQDLYTLGVTYIQIGEPEKAVSVFEDAVRMKDDYPKLYESLGMGYYKLGQIEKAILTWEKAVALDPELKQLEMLINDARQKQSMNKRVETIVAEISEGEEVAWGKRFELASLYISLKQHDNALEQLKLAIKVKKDSPELYDLLAEISAQKGLFAEAIGYEEKALKLDPDNETYEKRLNAMKEIFNARKSGQFHETADDAGEK